MTRRNVVIYDDQVPASWPEHKWHTGCVCIWCGVTAVQAQLLQPDTQGTGPCEPRRKWLLEQQTQSRDSDSDTGGIK